MSVARQIQRGDRRARLSCRTARSKHACVLALLGLLGTASLGGIREALDLPGASGTWTQTLQADDSSRDSSPADRAQAGTSIDLAPAALLAEDLASPPGEYSSLSCFELDRCRPGYRSGIERPPRPAV